MIAGYESLVTINGTGISGASIASLSSSNSLILVQKLGTGLFTKDSRANQFQDGFSVLNFSVTKPLCISGGEPLKNLLDSAVGVSGTIQDAETSISFTSGFITKYSVNYSLDEGPNATLDFAVYGEVSNNRVAAPVYFANQPHFAKRSLIDLELSGAYGILTDFSYSIEVPRVPVFTLGQKYPVSVVVNGPKKFDLSAKGYIQDDPNFVSNSFVTDEEFDKIQLALSVSGGTGGNILLDSQSGYFSVNSRDVSISIDDEYNFSIDATRIY